MDKNIQKYILQKMATGGEVEPSKFDGFVKSLKEAFSTPPPPQPLKPEDKNDVIRRENHERAMGTRVNYEPSGYAEGGQVEPSFLDKVKAYFTPAPDPYQNLANNGIPVQNLAEAAHKVEENKYADGGVVGMGDIKAIEHQNTMPTLSESLGATFQYNKTHPMNAPKSQTDLKSLYNEYNKIKDSGYAEGGEVQDDQELINMPDHPIYETIDRKDEPVDRQDEEAEAEKQIDEDPKKEIEEAANDEDDEKELAENDEKKDDSEDDESEAKSEAPRQLEGLTLNKPEALKENPEMVAQNSSDQAAGLQVSPDLSKIIEAQKSQAQPSLLDAQKQRDQALAGQQMSKGAALMGAGIARVSPDDNLKVIDSNDKAVSLPVQKYEEQIKNQQFDPNSNMSKVMKEYLKQKGFNVPENASAGDLMKVAPFLAKDQSLQMQLYKTLVGVQQKGLDRDQRASEGEKNRKNHLDSSKLLADARKEGYNKADQRQSQRLAGKFVHDVNNDPVIKPSRQNLASLEKSISLIKDHPELPITPQILSDAENDIANGMQIRGMGGSEGKVHRTELITMNRLITQAKQKYLNQPGIDLRQTDPQLVNQIAKTAQALKEDYVSTISNGKKQLADEYTQAFGDDPTIMKAVKQYQKSGSVGLHAPGDIVVVKGKKYQVGQDGDSLTPIGE